MGGNVFPGVNRRYEKNEYYALCDELSNTKFPEIFSKFKICEALEDKKSFGDMDVVCILKTPVSQSYLMSVFDTEYVKHNGDVWSLVYKGLQLDLITSNEHEYDFHENYLGRADRGNFVGKIAHQLGLKFGHDGLWMIVRSSDSHVVGDILLTADPVKAESFLDIKPLRSPKNFQEVFDNVTSSKYFNPEVFSFDNCNAISRVRDVKRPHYHKFLEMCEALPEKNWFPLQKDKSVHLPFIFYAFPHAEVAYNALLKRKEELDLIKLKFNGNLVREWTCYDGKELGELMKKLKIYLTDELILGYNTLEVEQYVKNFVNQMESFK